jgi:hypothetical protein
LSRSSMKARGILPDISRYAGAMATNSETGIER